ncbi:SIMPL domain-containing protein [Azohydromonas caseinilytica]|uniref:SIMPL domain-containing protein n=1 Tax=Azohydromonas caseinilytica TaxID=2728836 RepID=A0A848F8I9_9BURK|nr:SIMPL domain-containing protein [Azohydromonas caseinilytica]NML14351.1 SIMPL domain-containing protein [Azohydromonas caseinilytica]
MRAFALVPCLIVAALLNTAHAQALTPPTPQRVVTLNASATMDVPNDWLTLSFNATREGTEAGAVQSALRQALDAALAEARRVAKPGQVEVRAGNLSVYPRYTAKGTIGGWQGSAELQVEGRDMAAIAQLAPRITSMTIARVGYSLSREAREQVESEVGARAIERYKQRAGEVTKQFGFNRWSLREVQVNTDAPGPVPPVMMRAKAMAAGAADESLPVEPGRGQVSATVSGSIQME